jgi:hypothetical protein
VIPTITAKVEAAFELLTGMAERASDPSPAWHQVTSDVFDFQKRWWMLTYGPRSDKDSRAGRNPAYMEETGGLRRSATVKAARGQRYRYHRSYLLIEVTSGLATIHANRGRDVLGVPGRRETLGYARTVAGYILTGRT